MIFHSICFYRFVKAQTIRGAYFHTNWQNHTIDDTYRNISVVRYRHQGTPPFLMSNFRNQEKAQPTECESQICTDKLKIARFSLLFRIIINS